MSDPLVTEDTRESWLRVGRNGYEAQRRFSVLALSKAAALAENGVPQEGHIYTDRDNRIPSIMCIAREPVAKEVKPARPGQFGLYEVTVPYGPPPALGLVSLKPDGKARPMWSGFTETKPVDLAYNSKDDNATRTVPIVNRLGEPFDPAPMGRFPKLRLELDWITSSVFEPTQFLFFNGAVNRHTFWGIPPGMAMIESITRTQRDDNAYQPRVVVEVDPEGYDLLLNDLLPAPAGLVIQMVYINNRYRDFGLIPIPT